MITDNDEENEEMNAATAAGGKVFGRGLEEAATHVILWIGCRLPAITTNGFIVWVDPTD